MSYVVRDQEKTLLPYYTIYIYTPAYIITRLGALSIDNKSNYKVSKKEEEEDMMNARTRSLYPRSVLLALTSGIKKIN